METGWIEQMITKLCKYVIDFSITFAFMGLTLWFFNAPPLSATDIMYIGVTNSVLFLAILGIIFVWKDNGVKE
jgi:hypothetical protein